MSGGSPSPLPLAERMRQRMAGSTDAADDDDDVLASLASSHAPSSSSAAGSAEGSAAGCAATSASTAPNVALAKLLVRMLEQSSSAAATAFLASRSCSRAQRKSLAELACLEAAWRDCDQAIPGNVSDLASTLVTELYEPFWFFRSSLLGGESDEQPRALFARRMATPPLKQTKHDKYWVARSGTVRNAWLPALEAGAMCAPGGATFDAVVHFVQAGSGTGVHIGGGRVLTCAHVVDARDDDGKDESDIPKRVGRRKLVMFASGRTFIAECAAVQETADGTKDVALVALGAELDIRTLPTAQTATAPPAAVAAGGAAAAAAGGEAWRGLPSASVAEEPASLGEELFCVGNPSNVDLESLSEGGIEFEPPTWHTSVGKCEGYLDPDVQAARATQQARGRAPTRGELKSVVEAPTVDAEQGTYLQHSCWTYWGHSGAPLFSSAVGGHGHHRVNGLHCAWDDRTGMRHGQKLQYLLDVIAKAAEPAETTAAAAKATAKGAKAGGKAAKRATAAGGTSKSGRKRRKA